MPARQAARRADAGRQRGSGYRRSRDDRRIAAAPLADLLAPPLRRIVGLSLALAAAICARCGWRWRSSSTTRRCSAGARWTGSSSCSAALAVFVLSWLLFPAVVTMVMGFFLDRIAAAVEALDYPGPRPAAARPDRRDGMTATLRLDGLTILLNLLALPVYRADARE